VVRDELCQGGVIFCDRLFIYDVGNLLDIRFYFPRAPDVIDVRAYERLLFIGFEASGA
jgi:hypothetical protein